MQAVAHNPQFAHRANVPQSVGQDFVAADKAKARESKVNKRYGKDGKK